MRTVAILSNLDFQIRSTVNRWIVQRIHCIFRKILFLGISFWKIFLSKIQIPWNFHAFWEKILFCGKDFFEKRCFSSEKILFYQNNFEKVVKKISLWKNGFSWIKMSFLDQIRKITLCIDECWVLEYTRDKFWLSLEVNVLNIVLVRSKNPSHNDRKSLRRLLRWNSLSKGLILVLRCIFKLIETKQTELDDI